MTRVYGPWSPLADRLRNAMLMEYLNVRRLRRDAAVSTKLADEADARDAESDAIRAEGTAYIPYRSPSQRSGFYHRQHAERTRAMADGLMDGVSRMLGVLKGSY